MAERLTLYHWRLCRYLGADQLGLDHRELGQLNSWLRRERESYLDLLRGDCDEAGFFDSEHERETGERCLSPAGLAFARSDPEAAGWP